MGGLVLIVPLAVITLWKVKFNIHGFFDDSLSLEKTNALRGMLALVIAIHHFSGWFDEPGVLILFKYIGYLVVGIFFFLSGYGLMYGFTNKNGYLKGFLGKRLPTILLPYFLMTLVCAVYSDVFGEFVSAKTFVFAIIGRTPIVGGGWYIVALTVLYIVFFLIFRFVHKGNHQLTLLIFAILALIVMFVPLTGATVYSRSLLAFPCGVLWCKYRQTIDTYVKKSYYPCLIALLAAFSLSFLGKFVVNSYSIVYLTLATELISSCSFSLFVIVLLYKVRIGNAILSRLGGISYEIYLVHFFVYDIIGNIGNIRYNIALFSLLSFSLVILTAFALRYADKFTVNGYKRIVERAAVKCSQHSKGQQNSAGLSTAPDSNVQ